MAENQSSHRISIESKVINTDARNSTLGLFFGLFIAIVGIGVGAYLIMNGHDWAGGILCGTTIVSLVSTFVYGSTRRRKERERRVPQPE